MPSATASRTAWISRSRPSLAARPVSAAARRDASSASGTRRTVSRLAAEPLTFDRRDHDLAGTDAALAPGEAQLGRLLLDRQARGLPALEQRPGAARRGQRGGAVVPGQGQQGAVGEQDLVAAMDEDADRQAIDQPVGPGSRSVPVGRNGRRGRRRCGTASRHRRRWEAPAPRRGARRRRRRRSARPAPGRSPEGRMLVHRELARIGRTGLGGGGGRRPWPRFGDRRRRGSGSGESGRAAAGSRGAAGSGASSVAGAPPRRIDGGRRHRPDGAGPSPARACGRSASSGIRPKPHPRPSWAAEPRRCSRSRPSWRRRARRRPAGRPGRIAREGRAAAAAPRRSRPRRGRRRSPRRRARAGSGAATARAAAGGAGATRSAWITPKPLNPAKARPSPRRGAPDRSTVTENGASSRRQDTASARKVRRARAPPRGCRPERRRPRRGAGARIARALRARSARRTGDRPPSGVPRRRCATGSGPGPRPARRSGGAEGGGRCGATGSGTAGAGRGQRPARPGRRQRIDDRDGDAGPPLGRRSGRLAHSSGGARRDASSRRRSSRGRAAPGPGGDGAQLAVQAEGRIDPSVGVAQAAGEDARLRRRMQQPSAALVEQQDRAPRRLAGPAELPQGPQGADHGSRSARSRPLPLLRRPWRPRGGPGALVRRLAVGPPPSTCRI